MRNIFALFTALLLLTVFSSCKKAKQVDKVQEREMQYYASLIPIKLDVDKNLAGTLYFKAADKAYNINLDNIQANATMSVINDAIKKEKLLKVYLYKGSLEIAKLE